MESMEINKEVYEKKYKGGYGIVYPEGHVIRIYEHYIKNLLNNGKKNKMLDFGCGNGTHSLYFKDKGFEVYGVDISQEAIDICKSRFHTGKEKFFVIDKETDLNKSLNTKFDVIFANQVLYYLSDIELNRKLNEFYELLNDNGIVIFTMMASKNYYYNLAQKCDNETGLYKVELKGRLNETSYINFVKDEEDMKNKFGVFQSLYTGCYDFSMKEGSSLHYFFIGRKSIS
ncbi:class I SAM-dependent methyltransferase [Clostridium lundense]|uniref:class I SAM-dependent methyltransferase n=1 Tax=Clostridium lundense TaxID=319475 RepID=UPI0006883ECF|nr:class I SAM-dependent methyltransferase [Clostridium lundense]